MDDPQGFEQCFDIVYGYGLLYHIQAPEAAIAYMPAHCKGLSRSLIDPKQPPEELAGRLWMLNSQMMDAYKPDA